MFFQDSLLDIVTSLGCDEEKIILAGTAKANRFHLLDVSRNTPGSASVGAPSSITYQQVCVPAPSKGPFINYVDLIFRIF